MFPRLTGSARVLGLLVLLTAVLTAGAPSVIRIHRGDTLSELALSHHTTVAQLIALNHLPGNGMIYAGAMLRLPDVPDVPTGTAHVPGRVLSSAAHHRAMLSQRYVPSRSQARWMVAAAARRHGVPVDLAMAVAYQESGFQQRVVSPVDAIGVMQVLPGTGALLDRAYGRHLDLLRASDDIEAGVLLLRQLLDSTGTSRGALIGYYQGLGSLSSVGVLPQTRDYIANVSALRTRFRSS